MFKYFLYVRQLKSDYKRMAINSIIKKKKRDTILYIIINGGIIFV